jgi:hypothetical protein
MLRFTLAAVALAALAGCSTLDDYGIGGEPRLMCSYREGHAVIDDKLAGSVRARASVVRRFEDGDSLCAKPAAPVSPAASAASAAK